MSKHEKFNAIVDFIIAHLWDFDNSIFYFNNDSSKHYKLDTIDNKKETIIFRNIKTNEPVIFEASTLPPTMHNLNYKARIY